MSDYSQCGSEEVFLACIFASIDVSWEEAIQFSHMLMAGSAKFLSAIIFLSDQKRYVKVPPQGSAIIDACKVLNIVREEHSFENAKPSDLEAADCLSKYPFASSPRYTDQYVSDVRRGLRSCGIFLFLPFYFVCWVQIWNNLISQAGQIALHGTPNDFLQNLDPIALCNFIPLLDCESQPDNIDKMSTHACTSSGPLSIPSQVENQLQSSLSYTFTEFLLVSISMAYASVLQHYMYISPANRNTPPAYILVAISEAFVIVTGLELAFTQAPKNLRSFISALFRLMIGIAAAICIGLSPVSQDPYIVWMYGSLAIVGFVAGCLFYLCFRKSDSLDVEISRSVESISVEGHGAHVTQVADGGKYNKP
ncbi:uncharacterized protein N7477_004856 [Penicillium maclennaniae]|uniref:uncharacterized protein n=1 Tax=Penicillium maclennaniae TaxID=1343394 RepID=UPI0025425A6C|nr:uncharacterized protein N7477_004856 [Penicillium maclennaniae]KAJ5674922.1 hypothetical protein N7477_004856 [Penicillium maclennaniae]